MSFVSDEFEKARQVHLKRGRQPCPKGFSLGKWEGPRSAPPIFKVKAWGRVYLDGSRARRFFWSCGTL